MGAGEIEAAVARLVAAMAKRHAGKGALLLLGVANGGIELALRLQQRLAKVNRELKVSLGTLDISFHRDDIGRHPIPKEFAPTQIPVDVDGATVILVDDVLFSGRTVKAALDELFDHGRPTKVELAVLVDRGGRRMPMAADFVGLTLHAGAHEKVVVLLDPEQPKRDAIRIEAAAPAAQHSPI